MARNGGSCRQPSEVSRARRNVDETVPERQEPPRFRGGSLNGRCARLAYDPVCPFPGLVFRRFDLQAELLDNVTADKSARMLWFCQLYCAASLSLQRNRERLWVVITLHDSIDDALQFSLAGKGNNQR